jgi:hypothetical protein
MPAESVGKLHHGDAVERITAHAGSGPEDESVPTEQISAEIDDVGHPVSGSTR